MTLPKELICMKCAQVFSDRDTCPDHPDEPLLDTSEKEVCFFLLKTDDDARSRLYTIWITIGFCTGVVLGLSLGFILNALGADLESGDFVLMAGGASVGASVGIFITKKTFKPKFTEYTAKLERLEG